MGLCRGVDEEDSVLSLFPYSLSQDWGHQSSPYFLPHYPWAGKEKQPVRVLRGTDIPS